MKVGIIGPSKVMRNPEDVSRVAELIANLGHEIVVTADKCSSSELFANKYLEFGGKKVYSVVPLDDVEFGNGWVERIGEVVNCLTWRNQPEKLNEFIEMKLPKEIDGSLDLKYLTIEELGEVLK